HVPGNLIEGIRDRDEIRRAPAPQRLDDPVAKRRRPFRLCPAALEVAPRNMATPQDEVAPASGSFVNRRKQRPASAAVVKPRRGATPRIEVDRQGFAAAI